MIPPHLKKEIRSWFKASEMTVNEALAELGRMVNPDIVSADLSYGMRRSHFTPFKVPPGKHEPGVLQLKAKEADRLRKLGFDPRMVAKMSTGTPDFAEFKKAKAELEGGAA